MYFMAMGPFKLGSSTEGEISLPILHLPILPQYTKVEKILVR